jgi:UDP-2,3-diacylglucosamine hydrolase
MINLERGEQTIFFMSDAHLGLDPTEDEPRTRALASFFNAVTEQGGSLFILGDFFDFWFEYRRVIPQGYFGILTSLKNLTSSGVDVFYLGGNHDYWIGAFLEREVGVCTFTEPLDLRAQGRRIFLAHGDGLAGRDWPYRIFRKALRSRLVSTMYRLLHPDLGLVFAGWVSRMSRNHSEGVAPNAEKLWKDIGRPKFEIGFDTVVMGHIHKPITFSREDKELFVIGDWIDKFTFLVLQDGAFRLEHWKPSE